MSYQLKSPTANLKPIWISTDLLHILIQSTLTPASLPDSIEQVSIETCFVSGIILETGDINDGQPARSLLSWNSQSEGKHTLIRKSYK